jgi:hypothetical protein
VKPHPVAEIAGMLIRCCFIVSCVLRVYSSVGTDQAGRFGGAWAYMATVKAAREVSGVFIVGLGVFFGLWEDS